MKKLEYYNFELNYILNPIISLQKKSKFIKISRWWPTVPRRTQYWRKKTHNDNIYKSSLSDTRDDSVEHYEVLMLIIFPGVVAENRSLRRH